MPLASAAVAWRASIERLADSCAGRPHKSTSTHGQAYVPVRQMPAMKSWAMSHSWAAQSSLFRRMRAPPTVTPRKCDSERTEHGGAGASRYALHGVQGVVLAGTHFNRYSFSFSFSFSLVTFLFLLPLMLALRMRYYFFGASPFPKPQPPPRWRSGRVGLQQDMEHFEGHLLLLRHCRFNPAWPDN